MFYIGFKKKSSYIAYKSLFLSVICFYRRMYSERKVPCPADLEPYSRAYTLETKQKDEMMWFMGVYVQSAVSVAIERNLAGKKAKSKYLEKPIMQDIEDDTGLTQEEIDERELRKMILAEEQWMAVAKMKGLPETVIN